MDACPTSQLSRHVILANWAMCLGMRPPCLVVGDRPVIFVWGGSCPVVAVQRWLSYGSCPMIAILWRLSYGGCLVVAILWWLSCVEFCCGCPVMAGLWLLSCDGCTIMAVLWWLFCDGGSVIAVLWLLSFGGFSVVAVLWWLSPGVCPGAPFCPGCSVVAVMWWLPWDDHKHSHHSWGFRRFWCKSGHNFSFWWRSGSYDVCTYCKHVHGPIPCV